MKKIYFQPKLKAHLDQELGRNGGEEGEKHQTNKTENAAFFLLYLTCEARYCSRCWLMYQDIYLFTSSICHGQ